MRKLIKGIKGSAGADVPALKEDLHVYTSAKAKAEKQGGVLPYIGYIGTCRGIGYGF